MSCIANGDAIIRLGQSQLFSRLRQSAPLLAVNGQAVMAEEIPR
jgi:hypothetical protein